MFERIASFQALCAAAQRAAKGKRRKPGAAAFLANLEGNVLRLERELQDGTWRPGRYTVIAPDKHGDILLFEEKRGVL